MAGIKVTTSSMGSWLRPNGGTQTKLLILSIMVMVFSFFDMVLQIVDEGIKLLEDSLVYFKVFLEEVIFVDGDNDFNPGVTLLDMLFLAPYQIPNYPIFIRQE